MRIRNSVVVAFLVLYLGAGHGQTAQLGASDGPLFHFTEKPGPYAVGLKVVDQYDFSRTYRPKVDVYKRQSRQSRRRSLSEFRQYARHPSSTIRRSESGLA